MKVFSAEQIREIDAHTIRNEPIESIVLMERASQVFKGFFLEKTELEKQIAVFAGTGNNGGDALAVARMLMEKGASASIYLCRIGSTLSQDCQVNYNRLISSYAPQIKEIKKGDSFPDIAGFTVIDGIFGSGLNRPVLGYWAELIVHINSTADKILSIDIPSGMFADTSTDDVSINADYTLSFEFPKYSFFFPQSHKRVGEWESRSIGLSKDIQEELKTNTYFIDRPLVKSLLRKRKKFQHKGHFGHACLIGSSFGKTGAMILAGKACLKSGAGLVSYQVPQVSYIPLQTAFPEAMILQTSGKRFLKNIVSSPPYDAYGIGCGMAQRKRTREAFLDFLDQSNQPLVLDADALNILGKDKNSLYLIPGNSIITPHPKEFERLFGNSGNDFERNELQRQMSKKYNLHIVLKGMHSCISDPSGVCYFNSTGNPGMATAGSGDVLTGILTALVAQSYSPLQACLLGVYLHGLAGDTAKGEVGENSLTAMDMIEHLATAFKILSE